MSQFPRVYLRGYVTEMLLTLLVKACSQKKICLNSRKVSNFIWGEFHTGEVQEPWLAGGQGMLRHTEGWRCEGGLLEDLPFWVHRWQSSGVFLPKGEDGAETILLTQTPTPQEEEMGVRC